MTDFCNGLVLSTETQTSRDCTGECGVEANVQSEEEGNGRVVIKFIARSIANKGQRKLCVKRC